MTSHGSSLQTLKFVPPGGHRACANCSIAKAKCIKPDDATKCERCQRMNKECFAKSKPRRKKKPSSDLLGASDAGPGPVRKSRSRQSSSSPSNASRFRDEAHSPERPRVGGDTRNHPDRQSSEMSTPSSPASYQPLNETNSRQRRHNSSGSIIDAFFQQNPRVAADADNLVAFYRRYQEQHCPLLGPHTNDLGLRRENELLFMSILMAASFHDHPQQQRIASCCIEIFMDSMRQPERRTLKLLQGIICFLAWCHVNIHNGAQITNALRLTMTLAAEVQLGVTSPTTRIDPAMTGDETDPINPAEERTWGSYVEECRALARCYFITTIIGQLMRPCLVINQSIPWSQQLEEACAVLEGQEADADAALIAALARLVHVTDQMTTPCGRLEQGSSSVPFVDAENAEMLLGDFMSRLPQSFRSSHLFRLHLHTCEIMLYKLSIPNNRSSDQPVLISKTRSQAELQLRCIESVSAFGEIFHSIVPAFFICLPSTAWTQMHHISSVVYSIAVAPQLEWPAELLPAAVLPAHHRQRLAASFEQASLALSILRPGICGNGNVFDVWAAEASSESETCTAGLCMYENILATFADNDEASLGFAMDMARQPLPTPDPPQTSQAPQTIMMPSNMQQTQRQLTSQEFDQLTIQDDPVIWPSATAGDWNPWLDDASSAAFLDVSAENFDRTQRLQQRHRMTAEEQPGETSLLFWQGVEQWWPQTTSPP